MIRQTRRYPGPAGMFALSFLCHLVVCALIIWFNEAAVFTPSEEPVTYVDLATLPVASPQAGTPAPAESTPAPPAAPTAVPHAAMVLPSAKPKVTPPPPEKGKTAPQKPGAEEGKDFSERMKDLQRKAEERQLEAAVAGLKNRGGNRTVGMPGAKGTQAGSDYGSYLQSRLRDAFRDVIAFQSGTPQTLVRIKIAPDGHISDYRVEKRSGDPVFDDAVSRAVTLAGRTLKPPPNGQSFERVFRFKPEGVALP
ncbi:energy transduction protein TonB [Geomonas limicola]|uniref:Energy transduction protein TonB n=1 Tax=Geomonas limicola TaxID=2740186 RepID=A0A6V8NA92_9BACT|nr:energy transducer TonB [Geomonas limicola]GFO68804.1 energy transduction protein TonB [Geomonas limicola]